MDFEENRSAGIMWEYRIKVIRVVDGDTIDARIDLGFKVHINVRVRVYGINTPEVRTRDLEEKARGKAASNRMKELLKLADDVSVKSLGVDKFGRCLGIVMVEGGGRKYSVAEQLIKEGHGVEYFGGKR
tara:strand:- start:45 stop:431 length:387 start_codon:yes stop_codon:yes gene_type:complete